MKLYFVRHGETDWNKARKIQGQVDIPLNAFGRHLAVETGKGLKEIPFDLCISSPLSRARETGELILAGRDVPIVTDERIIEMAFGEWEGGCCARDGWNLPDEFHNFFDAPDKYRAPKGGEDFAAIKKRTGEFLEEIYKREDLKEKNVLITTHGAALCALLNNIKKKPLSEFWGGGVHKNCAVTEVEVTDGVPKILSENKAYYQDEVKAW